MGCRAEIEFYHDESGLGKPWFHGSYHVSWFRLDQFIEQLTDAVKNRWRFDQLTIGWLQVTANELIEDTKQGYQVLNLFPLQGRLNPGNLPLLDRGQYRVVSDYQKIVIFHRDCNNRRWRRVHLITLSGQRVAASVAVNKGVQI